MPKTVYPSVLRPTFYPPVLIHIFQLHHPSPCPVTVQSVIRLALCPWYYSRLSFTSFTLLEAKLLWHLSKYRVSTMRTGYAFLLAALSHSLTQLARGNLFYLKDQWSGGDFFQGWNWETGDDPTHGRVNYVSLAEAQGKNLTSGTSLFRPADGCNTDRPTSLFLFFFSGRK